MHYCYECVCGAENYFNFNQKKTTCCCGRKYSLEKISDHYSLFEVDNFE